MYKKIIGLLFLILMIGCTEGAVKPQGYDEAELIKQRAKWQALNIQNYQYRYYSAGIKLYDNLIQVKDGKTVMTSAKNKGREEVKFTIDELFDRITNRIAGNGDNEIKLSKVNISYDSEYGYPVEACFIFQEMERIAVDYNPCFSVKEFYVEK